MYTIKAIGIVIATITVLTVFILLGYLVNAFIATIFVGMQQAMQFAPWMLWFELFIAIVIMLRYELKSKNVDFAV